MDIVRAKKSFYWIAYTKNRTRFQVVVPLQAHDERSGGPMDALRLEGPQISSWLPYSTDSCDLDLSIE